MKETVQDTKVETDSLKKTKTKIKYSKKFQELEQKPI